MFEMRLLLLTGCKGRRVTMRKVARERGVAMQRIGKTSGILLLLTAMVLAGCTSPATGEEEHVIKLGYLPITHAAPLYFAKEFEATDLEGGTIELVRFGSWVDLLDALNAGQIDGASVLFELAMKSREN